MKLYTTSLPYGSLKRLFVFTLALFMTFSVRSNENVNFSIADTDGYFKSDRQKIYLHLDKSDYQPGENIWFKIYLLNNKTNLPEQTSAIVYVELIDGAGVVKLRRMVKTKSGHGFGDMQLSQNQKIGLYKIRAYTNQMRNFDQALFFEKNIMVGDTNSSKKSFNSIPIVSFYPEGGQLINGFYNRIAVKTTDEQGKPLKITGLLEDNLKGQITELNTSKMGTGMFHFIPESGKIYSAKIHYNETDYYYSLPYAEKEGVIMRVTEHPGFYRAVLLSSLADGLSDLVFEGSQKQGLVYATKIDMNRSKAVIKIPKEDLHPGIVSFSLLDKNELLICERMTYFESQSQNFNIEFNPLNERISGENQIEFTLTNQNSTRADISISIQLIHSTKAQQNEFDIKSYVQLNSELTGTLENSASYLNSGSPDRKKNLDLLMLTNHQAQTEEISDIQRFENETGLVISGQVINLSSNQPATDAEVFLSFRNQEILGSDKTKVDSAGRFVFSDLQFNSKTEVLLNTQREIDKKKRVKSVGELTRDLYLVLDSVNYPKTRLTDSSFYLNQNISAFTNERSILLEEVKINGESETREDRYNKRRMLYSEASYTLDFNDFPAFPNDNALTALKGRIPIMNRGSNSLLNVQGPLYLVDGLPVEDAAAINSIPVFDVDFVDVIRGPRAAIYGSRAAGGVIAIYTKLGNHNKHQSEPTNSLNSFHFIHEGISQPSKFYQVPASEKTDSITQENKTLFWQPRVVLNPGESKKFKLFAPDEVSNYTISIEGISTKGDLIKAEYKF